VRRDPGADERADRKAGQAEHVRDQAAAGAQRRRDHDPCDHDEVDGAH
jgi:hypothetical protein